MSIEARKITASFNVDEAKPCIAQHLGGGDCLVESRPGAQDHLQMNLAGFLCSVGDELFFELLISILPISTNNPE